MPEIGIVILNYNNWDDTVRCIESIQANPPEVSYRIFLVDNASTLPKTARITEFIASETVVYVQNETNLGYNGGNNVGIKKALEEDCQNFLLTNNDVCFLEGSIQKLWEYAAAHPKVGIVGPKIVDRNGNVQKSNLCRKTGIKEKYLVRTRLHAIFRNTYRTYFGFDRDYDSIFPVHAVLGCCLFLTGKCAEAVTPFDEYPFLYEEELMLGIHMEKQGFQTVYNGTAVIEHLHGGSTRHVKAFSYAHNIRSEIYYCRSYLHMSKRQILPLYLYRTALYMARCLLHADFRRFWKQYRQLTADELKLAAESSKL